MKPQRLTKKELRAILTGEPPKYISVTTERLNGAWIRWARKAAGLSLRQVATKLGYSPAFISDVELGRRNVNDRIIDFIENL